jgi:SAM-dependent methyltransferase
MHATGFEELLNSIRQGDLVSAVLSSPRYHQATLKASIRPILLKNKFMYQISEQDKLQVFHRNFEPETCANFIKEALRNYTQGVFTLKKHHYHLLVNKKNKMTVIKKEMKTPACPLPHNLKKNYVLPEGMIVPFLVELGVMTKDGKIIAKKYDKFRQINRFLEMVRDVVGYLPKGQRLEIVDFGCGKAYLTFALHYYLQEIEKREVNIIGLDLKKEVIAHCGQVAEKLNLKGLKFTVGDIKDFKIGRDVDLMISLHACDTATDAALEKAVNWNAKVILCVPCCQHELYEQIQSKHLETLLRHGILKERIAALVTDAARAEILTMLGYDVQVLEFIDMEHTPKNLLLRAVKGVSQQKREQARKRYEVFKNELGISLLLEREKT